MSLNTTLSISNVTIDPLAQIKDFHKSSIHFEFFTSCSFALISSLLTIFTLFRNENFADPSFYAYQSIAVHEFLLAVSYIFGYLLQYDPKLCVSYMFFLIRWVIREPVFYITIENVKTMIIFLSIYRAMACLFPTKFDLINGKKFWLTLTVGIVIISSAVFWPTAYVKHIEWDKNKNCYAGNQKNAIVTDTFSAFLDTYQFPNRSNCFCYRKFVVGDNRNVESCWIEVM